MPLLSLTIKSEELSKDEVSILLEREYDFTELKLLHVYHNIDSTNLTDHNDMTQEVMLFVKLGGLIENHKQIINYTGKYQTISSHIRDNTYTQDDYQIGSTNSVNNANSGSSTSTSRYEADIDIFNMIPIGASRCDGTNIVSRDVFKTLHSGGILHFGGELKFQLHYMNYLGNLVNMTTETGGISVLTKGKTKHLSFITLLFSYEEA